MTLIEDAQAPVLVQGVTGRAGARCAVRMRAYGTPVVGGTSTGHGGETVDGIPVFDTVQEAVAETGARAAVTILPPAVAADGLMEAAEAGVRLSVCVTEGVAAHDALLALQVADAAGMTVVGPNTAGLLVPRRAVLGFLPADFALPGRCALLSRSGTLSYEVAFECSRVGVGLSLWAGVGGDSLKGVTFADLLPQLAAHDETEAVVLIGEIGTTDEEDVSALLPSVDMPVVAVIAGRHAPQGITMGHAGALVAGRRGSWRSKVDALEAGGATVVSSPRAAAATVRRFLAGR